MKKYKPMTLNDAIKHALEKAKGDCNCSKDHAQLADWLKELKDLKKIYKNGRKNG